MNTLNTATISPDSVQTEQNQGMPQVQPMSDYEKFLFDLKGFLVIPNVLTDEEIETVREHTQTYVKKPESLPEHHRSPIVGPAEFLIDHPRVMGILQAPLPVITRLNWRARISEPSLLRQRKTTENHTSV